VRRRWDIDTQGEGIGDGRRLAPGARELVHALETPLWVAEDPHLHLFPHLRRRCEAADFPLALDDVDVDDDGTYVVRLRWAGVGNGPAAQAAVFALLGEIAESATYVRKRGEGVYEVATGVLEGDSEYAPHGHTLVLHVSGAG
jgi:hypothetical protein